MPTAFSQTSKTTLQIRTRFSPHQPIGLKNLKKAGEVFLSLVDDISSFNHNRWLSKGEKNITDVLQSSRLK